MFTSAGNKTVTIGEVRFSDPKFSKDPNAFDVNIHVTNKEAPAEMDWVRMEFSGDYGKGNFANRTQAQISMESLRKLGFEGDDLTQIAEQLNGHDAIVYVKESKPTEDGKVFYNPQYFVTSGNDPVALDQSKLKAKLSNVAALFGGGGNGGNGGDAQADTPAPTAAPRPPVKPLVKGGASPFAPRK